MCHASRLTKEFLRALPLQGEFSPLDGDSRPARMPRMSVFPFRLFLVSLGFVATAAIGCSADSAPAVVVAIQVRGTVEVRRGAEGATEVVKEGAQLLAADVVTTAKNSSVVLVLENGSVVSLRESSQLKITTALQSATTSTAPAAKGAEPSEVGTSQTNFELAFGEMLARVRKLNPSSTFEVQTPVSVAAVRGTVFEVAYRAEQSGPAHYRLSTASGLVHVTPRGGALVKVAGSEQVEFSARVRGKRVRVQPVKATKLSPQKQSQLEKEAQDSERAAAAAPKRPAAPAANATSASSTPSKTTPAPVTEKPKEVAAEKPPTPAPAPSTRESVKDAAADNSKNAAGAAAKKKKAADPAPKK